ncbi:MAG: multicopper oxidase family protein [Armatimonadota bacterium]|nr:multicopper oxidase family protein [Armatimonadota bacterium]
MSKHKENGGLSRRAFLRRAGLGAAAAVSSGGLIPAIASAQQSRRDARSFRLGITAERTYWPVLPGDETFIQRMRVQLLEGAASHLEEFPGSFLAPTIRANRGELMYAQFTNDLYDPSIIHWHGLEVSERNDGMPQHQILPGENYNYSFFVANRAGTYWYHPHPDGYTGFQVYYGMAGAFIVSDPIEQALPLPRGEFDKVLIVQDKKFDSNNQFLYGVNPFLGTLGDRVLINGKPDYRLSAATRAYRLRILNGSNARIYKLKWSNGLPMIAIGSDGGLLPQPVEKPFIMLAPGERVEIWADFSDLALGQEFKLLSEAFPGTHVGFGGGSIPNGTAIDVMDVRIDRQEQESLVLPTTLVSVPRYRIEDAVNGNNPRRIPITFDGMFLLNGAPYEPYTVGKNETVLRNTLECWELTNNTGTLMVAHPIHLHGPSFQVYYRGCAAGQRKSWENVRDGYVDEGWKDTVMLMPGESAKILVKTATTPQLSLYHCHNLDHEDMGMMRHFRVT